MKNSKREKLINKLKSKCLMMEYVDFTFWSGKDIKRELRAIKKTKKKDKWTNFVL